MSKETLSDKERNRVRKMVDTYHSRYDLLNLRPTAISDSKKRSSKSRVNKRAIMESFDE